MARVALPKLKSAALRGKVDVAIITMREDEEDAVLDRFKSNAICDEVPCGISYVKVLDGYFTVAVTRCLRQGTNEAQKVTETVIQKLAPKWIAVVGIAGAVPDNEFTLGDVIIGDRVYDLTLTASKQGKTEYSLAGGPVHALVDKVLAGLRARKRELQGWNCKAALRAERPMMDLSAAKCYGSRAFQKEVLGSLRAHFQGNARPPRYTVRPVLSSNTLVQDPDLVKYWKGFMRHVAAIEMEFAGAYIAAKGRAKDGGDVPVFTVRGISDVVGLRRQGSGDWTNYARNTAAAFTRALVEGSFLGSPRQGGLAGKSVQAPAGAQNPFVRAGTMPASATSYVARACDKELKGLLARQPLIYLSGSSGIGKSSLMERARAMLPARRPGKEGGWHFFFNRRLGDMDGQVDAFRDNFLGMFAPVFEPVDSWQALQAKIKTQPSVILLDDLGQLGQSSLQMLMPRLFSLVAEAPGQVRIVASLPGEIGELLTERKVTNPKYAEQWQRIRVPPFRLSEMKALLALLPEQARKAAEERRDAIMVHAAMGHSAADGLAPRKLQCLCARLFDAQGQGRSAQELAAIIDDPGSYR